MTNGETEVDNENGSQAGELPRILNKYLFTKWRNRRYKRRVTFPGHPFALSSGIAVLLAGFSTSAAFAADRYWDPINDNSYFSNGYTTYTAAAVVWNNTTLSFDTNAANPTNAAWAAGDDAF